MAHVVRGMIGVGLLLGALPALAQGVALSAVDPVGIARSGVQVAYGYSLEAATSNPALLSSLKDKNSAYLAFGLELSGIQQSMQSNQTTVFSTNRNRSIGGFGLAVRTSSTMTLGLKLDEPYLLHRNLLDSAPSRFLGDGLDFSARRLEGQLAWSLSPNLSLGVGLGVARLAFDATTVLRLGVPGTVPTVADGLVEQRVGERGNKVVPSYSLGLRWAMNPRWTLGFTHQSGLKGDLSLKADFRGAALGTYANDGLSTALQGTGARAVALLAASTPGVGSPTLELPSQTAIGVRHRLTPILTVETDLRWISAGLKVPTFPSVSTPMGVTKAPSELPTSKGHVGVGVSSELELGKFWTLRAGLFLDQPSVQAGMAEPLLGGSRTAEFSLGAGYKVWGGELNFGYQYRQSEDQDTTRLGGIWSSTGYRGVGTRSRMEAMGHLLALGFRTSF